jgi:hypothetical protein
VDGLVREGSVEADCQFLTSLHSVFIPLHLFSESGFGNGLLFLSKVQVIPGKQSKEI